MTGGRRLFDAVDAASLAVFRIMFGIMMVAEVIRYFLHHWIHDYFIEPSLHFKYLFFEWVQPWPGGGMYWHFLALAVLGVLIALGLFYRIAVVLFLLAFSYVFLLEEARYLNHFYLICLVSLLLCFAAAERWASLDRWRSRRQEPATIPYYSLFLLRAQLFIVYFYAGIAKINPDWLLRGEPVRFWLSEHASTAVIGPLCTQEWLVWLIVYGGLAFDLSVGFLLSFRRTRTVGLVLAFLFHTANNFLFRIGIFPYLAFALTLLFLEPDWPRRLLHSVGQRLKRPPVRRPLCLEHSARGTVPSGEGASVPKEGGRSGGRRWHQRWILVSLGVYLTAQILIPLRHWLYPGDVNWTDEGDRFAWRMKLRVKQSRFEIRVRDPHTRREWSVNAEELLTPWQFKEMNERPDMVIQLAHFLRDDVHRRLGVASPEVYMRALCSLNGAAEQQLVDPTIDLASETRTLRPARWILPRERRAGEERSPLAAVYLGTAQRSGESIVPVGAKR